LSRFHQFVREGSGWETRAVEVEFENPYLEIQRVHLVSPTRREPFGWTVCHRKAGVAVAAQTEQGGWVLIRQERVPFREAFWEFPAGQIDEAQAHEESTIVAAGLRELGEEAGYGLGENGRVRGMHYYASSPGFTDEHVYMIWVQGVVPLAQGVHQDPGESILEVRVFSDVELREMVREGVIRDANTLCSFARLAALGGLG
jgi:8-oxo-dGTP pyrophosphatase MutT (NUDIX family)